MLDSLDRLHRQVRGWFPLQRLAIVTRILLALAFVPTALIKVQGLPFTVMSTDTPVGYFFDAMHQTGAYWRFIGWSQLLAGACLLIPATATLGAVMFFPIVLNIFVITVSLHFVGTPWITGPMVLAGFFLLCWDYDRLKRILFPATDSVSVPPIRVSRLELAGYVLGTGAGMAVMLATRSLAPRTVVMPGLVTGGVAALLVLVAWIRGYRGAPATG